MGFSQKTDISNYKEDALIPIYATDRFAERRWPVSVYLSPTRRWWCLLDEDDDADGELFYLRWQMLNTWLARSVPVFERMFPNLPTGALLLRARFEGGRPEEIPAEFVGYEVALDAIRVHAAPETKTITIVASPAYETAHFNPVNVAERALVARIIEGVLELAAVRLTEQQHADILAEIVPNGHARQAHQFRSRTFRDSVRPKLTKSPIVLDALDAGMFRLGMGWRVRDQELGGDIEGKAECVQYLNSLVIALEADLCGWLKQYDREKIISLAINNHECAAIDQEVWMRTAAAVLALHNDKADTKRVIAEHEYKLNGAFITTRIIVECALCESPLEGGLKPGELDLARIMTLVAAIYNYGGWSDAIHRDVMEPKLKIRSFGDVHANIGALEELMSDYTKAGSEVRVLDAVENYADNLKELRAARSIEDTFGDGFIEAWNEEIGVSIDEMRLFLDLIEDFGEKSDSVTFKMPKSQFSQLELEGHQVTPELVDRIISALSLWPRDHWKDIPEGFTEKDRQPWRFRRRLSVLRKPLIQLDNAEDPTFLVAPGMVRAAFVYILNGYQIGDFPENQLRPKMRSWVGAEKDPPRQGIQSNGSG